MYQTTDTMKVQTENALAHTCVIGGCTALIGTVIFLFMMMADYLKTLLSAEVVGWFLEDASTFPNILLELVNRGWTESELKKVTQENFLRVFEAVENKAAEIQKIELPNLAKVKWK